jgi:DNA replication protein DnaC
MSNDTTLEKLRTMKLSGMTRAFELHLAPKTENHYSPDELVAHLVETEYDERYNRSLTRRLRLAKLRREPRFDEIKFSAERGLGKNDLTRLFDLRWIRESENVVITGATGTGKSFLACALGYAACREGFRVRYWNCMKLFAALKMAKADGSYQKQIVRLAKQEIIILDDFGLEVLDTQSRLMLLEILEDRISRASTVLASQLPVKNWHAVIGEPTVADAICDRLIHSAHRISLQGGSMRKRTKDS